MFATYSEVKLFLFQHLPYFSKKTYSINEFKLEKTIRFLEYLQLTPKFKMIHIGGTNGKGSTSNMMASVLQKNGYSVGLYTSPHLMDLRERIRVNGKMITTRFLINFINQHYDYIQKTQPSFFELLFVIALQFFKHKKIDFAVIEVGLGGRLDSTNVIKPLLSLITNISFDHMQWLGNTLKKIATEKAGIIKPFTPIVLSEYTPETLAVFTRHAQQRKAPLYIANQNFTFIEQKVNSTNQKIKIKNNISGKTQTYTLDLLGNYQVNNLMGVLQTIEILKQQKITLSNQKILQGLKQVKKSQSFQGRWDVLNQKPLIVADVAHNEAGFKTIIEFINHRQFENIHFIIGMVKDKEHDKIFKILPPDANYYFSESKIFRSLPANELLQKATAYGLKGKTYKNINEALKTAKSNGFKNDFIIICGSIFFISELKYLNKN